MAPPTTTFPASDLSSHIYALPNGRRRKGDIDLAQCQLLKWTQYECDVQPRGEIVCEAIERLFRRCEKGLTVETTAVEPLGGSDQRTKS